MEEQQSQDDEKQQDLQGRSRPPLLREPALPRERIAASQLITARRRGPRRIFTRSPYSDVEAERSLFVLSPITTDPYTVPASIVEEVLVMCERLGVTP